MTKKIQQRIARLMPNGVPRYIRCYDNGGTDNGGSIDRYTVVFTGNIPDRNRINPDSPSSAQMVPYIAMNGNPTHPQGVGIRDESWPAIDRPTYSHLGKRIKFDQLPELCRELVIEDYKEFWKLK